MRIVCEIRSIKHGMMIDELSLKKMVAKYRKIKHEHIT